MQDKQDAAAQCPAVCQPGTSSCKPPKISADLYFRSIKIARNFKQVKLYDPENKKLFARNKSSVFLVSACSPVCIQKVQMQPACPAPCMPTCSNQCVQMLLQSATTQPPPQILCIKARFGEENKKQIVLMQNASFFLMAHAAYVLKSKWLSIL